MLAFFKAKHLTGRLGETLAENFLVSKGYSLLDRNFRVPGGEIDLVANHKNKLIFVEVKTRRGDAFGQPEEGFSLKQKQQIIRTIYAYNQSRGFHRPWQLDLIAIKIINTGRAEIKHYKNILED